MERKTSWDSTWEKVFSTKEWGKYPPEELIRFTVRNLGRNQAKVLDAGCGTGAGSWYLAREGFEVFGVDGSQTAVEKASTRFKSEKLPGSFLRGDLIDLPFSDESFHGAIEVGAISQNRSEQIKKIFSEVYRTLKPNGFFFSMLIGTGSWGEGMGKRIEDGTYTEILEGPFAGLGTTHFFSESEIKEFFSKFKIISCEVSTRTYEERTRKIVWWVMTAQK